MSQVELRPNAFYELTSGCELTFADIECQYFIGCPEDMAMLGDAEDGAEANGEPTQAYGLNECEEEEEEGEGDLGENPLPTNGTVSHVEVL